MENYKYWDNLLKCCLSHARTHIFGYDTHYFRLPNKPRIGNKLTKKSVRWLIFWIGLLISTLNGVCWDMHCTFIIAITQKIEKIFIVNSVAYRDQKYLQNWSDIRRLFITIKKLNFSSVH